MRIISLLLSLLMIACVFFGCSEQSYDDTAETVTEAQAVDTPSAETENGIKLSSLTVNGSNISEYKIVYATSFSREDCYEDYAQAGNMLAESLKNMTGAVLEVVPDTSEASAKEILLGITGRPESLTRYYNDATKINIDEYCCAYSNGKLFMEGTCLGSVVRACEGFLDYISDTAVSADGSVNIDKSFLLEGVHHVTRIACIGDSITEGYGSENDVTDSYPAQMQKALGYGYDVVNYGKSGATMCSYSADHYVKRSYIEKSGYYDDLISIADKTDVVVIMLGSNDGAATEDVNALLAENPDSFKNDYTANLTKMVRELREKNNDIKIITFSTPKVFSGVRENNIAAYIRPLQAELAAGLGLEFYDMFAFSDTTMGTKAFPDGLHPDTAGYAMMGAESARVLKEKYNFT